MAGVFGGLAAGLAFKALFFENSPVDPYLIRYLALPGQLYLRLLFLLIVPLLVCSLSLSLLSSESSSKTDPQDGFSNNNVTTLNPSETEVEVDAKKLLLYTFAFFVALSMISAILGISLMLIFKPGVSSLESSTLGSHSSSFSLVQHDPILLAQKRIQQANDRTDSLYNLVW